jgi:hypothetical protein
MKIIQHYLNFRPSVEWIVKESGLPYLELDIEVPHEKIYQEWLTVADQAVPHRDKESVSEKFFYGHNGWKSLVLYGTNSTATSSNQKPFAWTSIADKCPITKSWLADNFIIDENTNRIRFMLLEPQGHVLPHIDRPTKGLGEINVAITHPADCNFRFSNYGNVPFIPGRAIMVDISNEHLVYNNSNESRLHIIVHGSLKNKNVIKESYASRYYS